MNVCVIKEDKVVMIDGEAINFDFELASNVWAIQWNGTTGEIEFNDGSPNEKITDFSSYQYLIDAFNTEKQEQAASAPIPTYAEKRAMRYDALNQDEMRYDDEVNGTTTWVDAITAIKNEIPK